MGVSSWESNSKSGDVDLEFGVEVAARATNDLGSLPGSIWGKASKVINGWGTSARAELDSQDMSTANIEIEVENEEQDLTVKVCGTAGDNFAVSSVEATKAFDSDGSTITVNPRYDVATEDGDVVLGYVADRTEVEVTASRGSQKVSVSQQVDDDNRVTPSITSDGAITLEWEKRLGDDKSVTTLLKPNELILVLLVFLLLVFLLEIHEVVLKDLYMFVLFVKEFLFVLKFFYIHVVQHLLEES